MLTGQGSLTGIAVAHVSDAPQAAEAATKMRTVRADATRRPPAELDVDVGWHTCVDCPGTAGRITNIFRLAVMRQWQFGLRLEF